ncbi:AraC family transcriptional regulator [Segetibacter aerophilus]|uniref:AraC family transcriptional regulator n=1 Tax=Segetibacter aerophilus TaxID=670293 RepID=A0A512B7W1_9BACT|nr:AraC family transcriptional regulator [Segetibacter aerophilus]GEO08044.1 AraC family transcriptional regulator [Segetibacter aerophilus]
MKPLVEQLPLSDNTSFVARTHRTPNFEVNWHQHIEYELILFTEGAGLSFIGNYVGEFEVGDVFFLGANLPHTFKKSGDVITSAIVVHFKQDFWGNEFLNLPESKEVLHLLKTSLHGLKIKGKSKEVMNTLIGTLEKEKGFRRIITLCECLDLLAKKEEFDTLSTQEVKEVNNKNRERIDRIFHYTMENFREPIQLSTIARLADMSIPAFCNYFKKSTRKRYIDFLNEVRIGYACKLLTDNTSITIEGASYESGFSTIANFNKQFLKVKAMTPSKYRKIFSLRQSQL